MVDTRTRAAACALALGGLLLAPPASQAANLVANPGFETTGSAGTVFSDTLPDLGAWQVTSGNVVLAGGTATTAGLGSSTDLAVVRNSQDYQDGTASVLASQATVSPQLTGGVVVRYRDTANFYLCGHHQERGGGAEAAGRHRHGDRHRQLQPCIELDLHADRDRDRILDLV